MTVVIHMIALGSTVAVAPPSSTRRMDRQLVLVVDDDLVAAKSLARGLLQLGYGVVVASAAEARARAACEKFKAIVSDSQMSTMTGNELLEVVRANDPDVPFLLITSHHDEQVVVDALNLGADRLLRKPVDHKAVGAAIEASVRVRQESETRTSPGEFDVLLGLLRPVYQPIVSRVGACTVAHEALLRSDHPVFNHPGRVLDFAERAGRVRDLGRRIRGLVTDRYAGAREGQLLFVNLHAQELFDPALLDATESLHRIASRVVLEVTERESVEKIDDLLPRLSALRALGFRIAVDDLGSGYSGLASLVHMEPDFVKLDMSLVRGIETSHVRQRLVKSMTTLARELGTTVVAEGIETEAESKMLLQLGCDWMQGFLFAKPEPVVRDGVFVEEAPVSGERVSKLPESG